MSNLGYPASNVQSNLPQSTTLFYDKQFIENLKSETPFVRCAERRDLPLNSGNQLVLFEYQPFGANTSQASEGTPGPGQTAHLWTNTSTIGELIVSSPKQKLDYIRQSMLQLKLAA